VLTKVVKLWENNKRIYLSRCWKRDWKSQKCVCRRYWYEHFNLCK